ncbi:MAG: hypothetical protein ACI3ZY_07730 [Parabacteroides sp.]
MLNLSSSNEVVWKEFTDDYHKCCYWFFKKMGGDRQVQQLTKKLEQKVLACKADVVGDLVEYHSKHGNNWIGCLCGWYCGGEPLIKLLAFAYYETIGSYGAFAPLFENGQTYNSNPSGVQILTSHFFLRAKDRLKYRLENKQDLARAILFTIDMTAQQYLDEASGEWRMDYQLPQGIARGVIRSQNPLLVEIRTCLSQAALNRKQSKDTAKMREVERLLAPRKKEPSTVGYTTQEDRAKRVANTRRGMAMIGRSEVGFDLSYDLFPIVVGYMSECHAGQLKRIKDTKCILDTFLPSVYRIGDSWNEMDTEQRRDAVARLIVAVMRDSGMPKTKFSQARAYVVKGTWIKLASLARPDLDTFKDPHVLELIEGPGLGDSSKVS